LTILALDIFSEMTNAPEELLAKVNCFPELEMNAELELELEAEAISVGE